MLIRKCTIGMWECETRLIPLYTWIYKLNIGNHSIGVMWEQTKQHKKHFTVWLSHHFPSGQSLRIACVDLYLPNRPQDVLHLVEVGMLYNIYEVRVFVTSTICSGAYNRCSEFCWGGEGENMGKDPLERGEVESGGSRVGRLLHPCQKDNTVTKTNLHTVPYTSTPLHTDKLL